MWIKRNALLAAVVLVSAFAVHGEDIDLFSAIQADGEKPNLMFLLDNSGNADANATFSCPTLAVTDSTKAFGFEQCALYRSVQSIASSPALLGNINMGLMLYNAGDGGKMKYPSTSPYNLSTMDSAGISAFSTTLAGLRLSTDKVNNSQAGESMQEVWAYYKGATGQSGTTYSKHFTSACQKNFVVFIANAMVSGGAGPNWGTAQSQLEAASAADGTPDTPSTQSQISISGVSNSDTKQWAAEWANFMYHTDMSPSTDTGKQNITTYTIIVTDGKNASYVSLLKAMAAYGGGKAFVVSLGDLSALEQALLQIFNEVQGINSAFSSSSLPVSANAQNQYLNQVFMGVFRPDAAPRWQGNLKQYKLGVDPTSSTATILVDANGADAISHAGTGFISPNAQSFWTSKNTAAVPDSLGGFWVNNQQGAYGGYDLADGEIVEKGGVNQRIRLANQHVDYSAALTSASRQFYTCTSGCIGGSSLSATPFATSNASITATLLGSSAPPVSISAIARSDSTNTATVTLASAPSPALTSGQTVTISGATATQFNGSFSATVLDATHFSYSLPASSLTPPTPATGTYTVTLPASSVGVSSITRNGTTATVTTSAVHGFVTGQSITIAGATQSEYNGTFAITVTGTSTFTYTIVDTPSSTITLGGVATNNTKAENFSFASTDIVATFLAATTKNVTVTNSANGNTPPKSWVLGNSVTVSGVSPSGYNGTFNITGVGNACTGGTNNKSFCYTITTSPVTPATGTITATTSSSGIPVSISSLTRAASTCAVSGAYASSGSSTVLATATTGSAHGLATGSSVNISGTTGAGEGNYVKSGQSVTVTSSTTFTYPISVAPACSETTSGMLATPSGVDRDALIHWVRGEDNAGDEPSPQSSHVDINIRPSIHGDVLHSRPVIINYGGSIGVVAFYGANDGVFRAVNGNQTNPTGSTLPAPGNELWGFIPQEFFSRFSRLRNNSPLVKLAATPTGLSPTPLPKDYFFDGSTGVYRDFSAGTVYIFLSARRGGRVIYAIDVTSPTNPKYLWSHTSADAGFSELGQTWSQPKAAKVQGYSNPVLIFGAGYDTSEDAQPASSTRTMGRGIFILDAVTGSIVWQAKSGGASNHCEGTPCQLSGMTYAVPSDVTMVDRNFDGYIDRIYVGDVGGNMWRVDLEPTTTHTSPSYWQTTLLASVGGSGSADKRKIFFPPSIVAAPSVTGAVAYDAVLFSTGDREHPVYADAARSIANRFYMIKDYNQGNDGSKNVDGTSLTPVTDSTSSTAFDTVSGMFDVTPITVTAPAGGTTTTSVPYDGTGGGFYLNLIGLNNGSTHSGEKGVNAAVTVGGWTYFATNTPESPDSASCQSNLGTARAYKVNFFTGESSSTVIPGGGLAPTAVVARVTLDNGEVREICIGCGDSGQSAISFEGASNTPDLPVQPRRRSFWYEKR